MKKLLISVLVSVALLAGCTDVEDVVINKKEDIEAYSADLKKLSDEDKNLLAGYFIRAEVGGLFGVKADYGVTVGEAISKQKEFIASQKRKEAEKEKEKAARKEKAEKVQKIYTINYAGFEEVEVFSGDGITLKFMFTNNSGKSIDAINSSLLLNIEGIDKSVSLNMGDEVFKTPLKNGETVELNFTASADNLEAAKIKQGNAKVSVLFDKLTVLNTDGKVVKVLE